METLQAIHTRKSIRAFLDKEVPREIILKILNAGIRAPSGGNRQPWRFIVVTDQEKMKHFDPVYHQPWIENAPAIIVACVNPHDTWEKYDEEDCCYVLDVAAAIQNMLLAIHDLGLGGVWIGSFSKRNTRRYLNIPKHWQIVSLILFGYYKEDDSTEFSGKRIGNAGIRPRKPVSEVAFFNDAETALQE